MNNLLEVQINTTDKGLAYICELYWKVDSNLLFVHKVAELAQITKIDKVRLPTIIREACTAYVSDWKCSSCNKPYVFSVRGEFLKSRSLLLSGSYRKISFMCHECETMRREKELAEKTRQEEAARKVREAAGNELRKKIREMYDLAQHSPVNVQELSLKDMIYLVSILRGGALHNPGQGSQGIRNKMARDSEACRPPNPEEGGHFLRTNRNRWPGSIGIQ